MIIPSKWQIWSENTYYIASTPQKKHIEQLKVVHIERGIR